MHALRMILKKYIALYANTPLLRYSLKQPLFANFHKREKAQVTLQRAKGCCVSRILNNHKACTILNLYAKIMANLLRLFSSLFNISWRSCFYCTYLCRQNM
uniref:Uncharacterized protein n=1 Tax=Micrurus spixii TaxID=129469 RepID=A0A2D4NBP3_9SAUR